VPSGEAAEKKIGRDLQLKRKKVKMESARRAQREDKSEL